MKYAKIALWVALIVCCAFLITAIELFSGKNMNPYLEGGLYLACIALARFLSGKLDYWKINRDYRKKMAQDNQSQTDAQN